VSPNADASAFVITAAVILALLLVWTVIGQFILKRVAIFLGCCAVAAIFFFDYGGFGS
jgi:hypothetical protein